jgi:hypothetical protein
MFRFRSLQGGIWAALFGHMQAGFGTLAGRLGKAKVRSALLIFVALHKQFPRLNTLA